MLLLALVVFLYETTSSSCASFCFFPTAAADQSVRDGEDEGGAREEEMLLGTRGTQGKG